MCICYWHYLTAYLVGADIGSWTLNLRITSALLCLLSYISIGGGGRTRTYVVSLWEFYRLLPSPLGYSSIISISGGTKENWTLNSCVQSRCVTISTMAPNVCTNFDWNEDWELLVSPLAPQSRLNRCDILPRAYFLRIDKRALSIHK